MMRILVLGDAHSVHIAKIIDGLCERGFEVMLFSLHPAAHPSSPQTYSSNVRIFQPLGGSNGRGLLPRLALKAIWHSLMFKPDLVWATYASSYGTLLPIIPGKRKVSSVLGSDIMVQAFKRRYRRSIRRGLRSADLVLATSNALRDYVVAFTCRPIKLTPFGPSDFYFDPQDPKIHRDRWNKQLGISEDARLLVCNKWMKHVYGIDVLIDALSLLVDGKESGDSWHLVLTGEGPEAGQIISKAKRLGLADRVHLVGYLEQQDVRSLLTAADLAVFPSRSESFGVSILEAIACGTPVVAHHVGGIPEVVGYGRFADMLSKLSPNMLAQLIEKQFENGKPVLPSGALEFSGNFRWSLSMDRIANTLRAAANSQRFPLLDSGYEQDERPVMIFAHSTSYQESPTRARALRVARMREAFQKTHRVIELSGNVNTDDDRQQWLTQVCKENDIEFGYIEYPSAPAPDGDASLTSLCLEKFTQNNIPCGVFLPDLHEMDDSYVNAPPIPQLTQLARFRRAQDIEHLIRFKPHLFVPSKSFKSFLCSKFPPAKLLNISSLPGGIANTQQYEKSKKATSVEGVNFVYAGGIGPFYRMDRLLEALAHFPKIQTQTHLLLRSRDIGALRQPQKARVEKVINCIVKDCDLAEFSASLNSPESGVGLVLTEPLPYFSLAMPIKLFSYLEQGWPILCIEGTATAEIVTANNLGWAVENSTTAIAQMMNQLLDAPDKILEKTKAISEFTQANTWEARRDEIINTLTT